MVEKGRNCVIIEIRSYSNAKLTVYFNKAFKGSPILIGYRSENEYFLRLFTTIRCHLQHQPPKQIITTGRISYMVMHHTG